MRGQACRSRDVKAVAFGIWHLALLFYCNIYWHWHWHSYSHSADSPYKQGRHSCTLCVRPQIRIKVTPPKKEKPQPNKTTKKKEQNAVFAISAITLAILEVWCDVVLKSTLSFIHALIQLNPEGSRSTTNVRTSEHPPGGPPFVSG